LKNDPCSESMRAVFLFWPGRFVLWFGRRSVARLRRCDNSDSTLERLVSNRPWISLDFHATNYLISAMVQVICDTSFTCSVLYAEIHPITKQGHSTLR
jgi:hypothetical protein